MIMANHNRFDGIESDFAWDCHAAHVESLQDFTVYIRDNPAWWQGQLDAQHAVNDRKQLLGWQQFAETSIEQAKRAPPGVGNLDGATSDVYVALQYVIRMIDNGKIDWLGQDADEQRMRIMRDAMHALLWVEADNEPDTDTPSY